MAKIFWNRIINFRLHEFDSPEEPGSGDNMDEGFIKKLQATRVFYDRPMFISSGWRTPIRNQLIGGSPDSSHLKGLAADIACGDSGDRYELVYYLLLAGFRGIGVYEKHIHVDNDLSKPKRMMWVKQGG